MKKKANFFRKFLSGVVTPVFDGMAVAYTLRQLPMTTLWTNAVIKVRRSSDNSEAYVFYDGSSIDDTITLNSPISTVSDTTPSATTLGTWVGADNAYVVKWYGITPDNIINTNYIGASAFGQEFSIISFGTVLLKNGKPVNSTSGTTRMLTPTADVGMNSTENFTTFAVGNNDTANGTIYSTASTGGGSNTRFTKRMDGASDILGILRNTTYTDFRINLLSVVSTLNQRLYTLIKNGFDVSGYYNGVFQDTETYTGTYLNDTFQIASDRAGVTKLNGGIQEIIKFHNASVDRPTIEADINRYYSIY